MFGFNKKKKTEKKQSSIDKIILGAVIGGAIGSVIGVGIAPNKGQDTRKQVVKKTNKLFGNIHSKIKFILKKKNIRFPNKSSTQNNIKFQNAKKIPHEN